MSSSIDAVLQAAVDSGAVPNVVGVAADEEGVTYEGAAGPRAAGGDEPVSADSIFRIASMTKMVCTVAALQQRERGHLDFDAPVDTYCPEFAAVEVLDGFDDDRPRIRAPASRATIKQLVTHTAGLAYSFWNANLVRWEAATRTGSVPGGLADFFAAPMVADPGTTFEYGTNIDWLGRVVEAASGQSLDAYLAEHMVLSAGGVHQPDWRPQLSDGDPHRGSEDELRLRGRTGDEMGLGPAPQHQPTARHALRRKRRLGRNIQTPTSGSTPAPGSPALSIRSFCRSSHTHVKARSSPTIWGSLTQPSRKITSQEPALDALYSSAGTSPRTAV